MANFILSGGSAVVDVPPNSILTVGVVGAGQANLYTVPYPGTLSSGNDLAGKVPYAANPVIYGANSYYRFPANTGESAVYIEAVGGTVEWVIGASAALSTLSSFNTPYTLTRVLSAAGNQTNNAPRGRGAIAAGQSSAVITSSQMITGQEWVGVTLFTADATCTSLRVQGVAGQFTVFAIPGPATANTTFDFVIVQ